MMIDWLDQPDGQYEHYSELRQEMRAGFAGVDASFARLEAKMGELKAEILKVLMAFWIASLLTIVGALVTLSRISH